MDQNGHRFCLDVLRETTVGAVKELIEISKVICDLFYLPITIIDHVILHGLARMSQRSTSTSTCQAEAGSGKKKNWSTRYV